MTISSKTAKKSMTILLSISLGLVVLFSSLTSYAFYNSETAETLAWSGTQTSTAGTYYEEARGLKGSALKSSLDTIISRNVSTSYDWSRYEAADEAEGESSKVLQIYTRTTIAKTAHVNNGLGWNREHTYPDSKISSPANADNLHIFSSDNKVNSIRGSKLFGVVTPKDASTDVQDSLGNTIDAYTNSTVFEPGNAAKGEVARATLYLNTAYGYTITGNFTSEALCLDWAKNYPVTNREIYRNNTVYTLQGNRNPYIDHPEFIDMVYDPSYSGSGALNDTGAEVTPTSLSLSPSSASIGIGNTQNLTVSALPSGASTSVTWSSSNAAIASVSNGVVTGVSAGNATITATSTLNTSVKATATITVENVTLTGISIKTPATKSTFTLGSVFSYSGLVITASYSNSTTADLSTGFEVGGVNTDELGQQTATITYDGKTATYNVTITNNGAAVGTSSNYASELFFSEYIEASSGNDKLLEIYNGTGSTKSLYGYSVYLYSNGATTPNYTYSFLESDVLVSNCVISLVNTSAVAAYKVGTYVESNVTYFNGNDAVALLKNGTTIDLIGVVGTDPGTAWTGTAANGSASTANMTLRRTTNTASPNTTFTWSEWNAFANQQSDDVGIHTFSGGMSSGDITNDEQAIAWASYFLDITDETCQAMSGSFGADWTTLANEYNFMAAGSKDAFVDNTPSSATISAAIERYQLIVNKYGISNFVTDGDGISMFAIEKQLSSTANMNDLYLFFGVILAIVSTLFAFLFSEKRKHSLQ